MANDPQERYQTAKELLSDLLSLREWQALRFHSDKTKNCEAILEMECKEGIVNKTCLEYVVYSSKGRKLALLRKMEDEFYIKADSSFCVGTIMKSGEKKTFCSLTIPGNFWYPILPEDWISLKNSEESTWFTFTRHFSSSQKTTDLWELKILDNGENYKIRIRKQNFLQLFSSDVVVENEEEERINIDILSTLRDEEENERLLTNRNIPVAVLETLTEEKTQTIENKLVPRNEIVIGRNPECCDLSIKLPFKTQQDSNYVKMWKISKRHLSLLVKNGELYAMDMESTRGSIFNQTPMKPKELYRVNGPSQIVLGEVTIQLKPILE